ncbi:rust resistance kinase Lr10 [Arachis ipaensis]|uniref:rust resistance kinase Lr10 n=1 Tax=Arachis ipaensis TaxID=130454 RepID=UPI0007AEFA30|nr:rust resistance kinase Lr10 [Arachis ipaensis]XP_025645807.1 rust resistance kinase Lr10 [Arachis hypogaea]QHO05963.1 uncharacterized protein DS421_14g450550 [Arachis hypogaea]
MARILLSMIFLLCIMEGECHNNKYECGRHRCGPQGPPIRFPFRLKDKEPLECGVPGFDLTCDHKHNTLIEFSSSVPQLSIKLLVMEIGYETNFLYLSDPENCLASKFLKLINTSISPFQFQFYNDDGPFSISIFNCSPDEQYHFSCPVYVASDESETLLGSNLVSCTKVFNLSTKITGIDSLMKNRLLLEWPKPNCTVCEASGKQCMLKNNGSNAASVECYGSITGPMLTKKILFYIAGPAFGSLLLLLLAFMLFKSYRYFRMKGDQARSAKFLEDYRALKPTRFSYADIKRITNGFKDKLGEGAHGAVFKGKLSNIIVAVKVLNNTIEDEGKDFINEVGTIGKIHHVNVVRLLGFCAQGFHRALVYDFFSKGSLENFITTPDNNDIFLGWDRLHQIALAIAKGIEYLHHGCEQQILHFNINPRNILLDDRFTPKITDLGLAKLCSKDKSAMSMTAVRGTLGYISPEVVSRNFGTATNKADIYSYGMLLLEMVGGRKNMVTGEEGRSHILYPEWAHNLIDGGDVHVHVEDEHDIKIARKIAIVGLWCIKWDPSNRPSAKTLVKMLESDGDKLTVPSNPLTNNSSNSRGCLSLEGKKHV